MLRHAALALVLTGQFAAPAPAQDEAVGAKIEEIRQKVKAAADTARAAQDAEDAAREEASKLLEGLGAEAIPHLLKVVEQPDNEDPDFVARAKTALERLGWVSPEQRERMAELLQAIKDDDFDPLEDAFAVLECGLHAVNELDKALQSAEWKTPEMARQRGVVLKILGELASGGRFETLPVLVRHLGAAGPTERTAAARGLARAGDQPVDDLTGEPDAVRLKALAAAVAKYGVVAPLLALASHGSDSGARAAAAAALGALMRTDAAEGLVLLAGHKDAAVAGAASAALAKISGKDLDGGPAWTGWWGGVKAEFPPQVPVPPKAPGR